MRDQPALYYQYSTGGVHFAKSSVFIRQECTAQVSFSCCILDVGCIVQARRFQAVAFCISHGSYQHGGIDSDV
jgi:hypothetical protein